MLTNDSPLRHEGSEGTDTKTQETESCEATKDEGFAELSTLCLNLVS